MDILKSIGWRLLRTTVAMLIATGGAWATNDPRWVWAAPIIAALGKALRDTFGIKNIPV